MGKRKHRFIKLIIFEIFRVSEKKTYLNDIEFLGNDIPGPG